MFSQHLSKIMHFQKTAGTELIVSHANNHLLTLYEFGLDKANYNLKITRKTLWAKSSRYKL